MTIFIHEATLITHKRGVQSFSGKNTKNWNKKICNVKMAQPPNRPACSVIHFN